MEQRTMTEAGNASGTLEQALAHTARLLDSNAAMAAEQAAEILKVVENQPVAMRLLAAARAAQHDLPGAIDTLQALVRLQPNWALAQLDLGIALGRGGR